MTTHAGGLSSADMGICPSRVTDTPHSHSDAREAFVLCVRCSHPRERPARGAGRGGDVVYAVTPRLVPWGIDECGAEPQVSDPV